ncbi:MAG: tetratricopeptide repeat protein [Acidimicrobiales bacterium]
MSGAVVEAAGLRALEDERDFLLRSIDDLDAELSSGDISVSDHRALRDRYTVRAAEVLRALDALVAGASSEDMQAADDLAADTAKPARRRRKVFVYGAVACFAAAALVLVVAELAARLPGQTVSGSISLSAAQQIARTLAQAQVLETEGSNTDALTLYRQVLAEDPTQAQALAEAGWLEFEVGVQAANGTLLSQGQRDEQEAQRVDPTAYEPHLYMGSMLLVEGDAKGAVAEFDEFMADGPSVSALKRAWPFVVRAFTDAGKTPPPAPPGVS